MKEITGDLWDYYLKPNHAICITTNGFVKANGDAVMGRGCALEATRRIPGIAKKLGTLISNYGNQIWYLGDSIFSFPVKHKWWEEADLELIKKSVRELREIVYDSDAIYVLPRPGCGNGRLKWEDVKPLLQDLPDNVLVITKP